MTLHRAVTAQESAAILRLHHVEGWPCLAPPRVATVSSRLTSPGASPLVAAVCAIDAGHVAWISQSVVLGGLFAAGIMCAFM